MVIYDKFQERKSCKYVAHFVRGLEGNCTVFQGRNEETGDFFDNLYYRRMKKSLIFVGQYPYQDNKSRAIYLTIMWMAVISFTIAEVSGLIHEIRGGDRDRIILCMPSLCINVITFLKYVNLEVNKSHFRTIFDGIKWEWKLLTAESDMRILQKFTSEGTEFGVIYEKYMIGSSIIFLLTPIALIVVDVILNGHETHPRVTLYLNDYFIDGDKYYFLLYIHQFWCTLCYLLIVYTVDTLSMIITQHICGLFVLCGHRVKTLAESFEDTVEHTKKEEDFFYDKLRQCVITHKKAIEFAEYMSTTNARIYLFILGLNMVAISIAAVQVVIKLNEFQEFFRFFTLLIGLNIHMFIISLPGQKLINYSEGLAEILYSSDWYKIPIKMQRIFLTMLMRSRKPSKLTAGGLYDMNMENYGLVLKTSVSYFTMFLSFRE